MEKHPDQLSRLIIEADALLLMLHHHREDTPADAIVILRNKLQLILSLIEGLEDDATTDSTSTVSECPRDTDQESDSSASSSEEPEDTITQTEVADYIEETVEDEPESRVEVNSGAPAPLPASRQQSSSNIRRPVSTVFNLNDKFRFRRELFGNSEVAYVEALNMLSAMNSLDEAKEYLYEDLEWDPANEDVIAFIELLANYYK